MGAAGGPSAVVAEHSRLSEARARGGWRWLALVGAMSCLTISACHRGANVGGAAAESESAGSVTLRVVNHSWLDITVYLQQGSHRDRIGTATAVSTTEFQVALREFAPGGDYRLFGNPIGSRQTVRSEPLRAQDGDVVTWTLEDNLSRSFVEVR
jgi:hypothetical protein